MFSGALSAEKVWLAHTGEEGGIGGEGMADGDGGIGHCVCLYNYTILLKIISSNKSGVPILPYKASKHDIG
jgi:hypothetical protein